jgi:hypothetical protein
MRRRRRLSCRSPTFAADRCAVTRASRMLTRRRSSSTPSRAMGSFWRSIPRPDIRGGSPRCSLSGVKRSFGAVACSIICRAPTGLICAATRMDHMSGMRGAGWPCLPRRSIPSLISCSSTSASRLRLRMNWSSSTGRWWSFGAQAMNRLRLCPSSSCNLGRVNSPACRRHGRRASVSLCRLPARLLFPNS